MGIPLVIEQLRADTPGCAESVYFNHSGASLLSWETVETITDHLVREAHMGGMEAAGLAAEGVERARVEAAKLVGAKTAEIAFCSSGSAAWGAAFAATPALRSGDRILVGRQEWGGNLATMQIAAAKAGATVEVIPTQEDGSVDAAALGAMIDDKVRLISLTWLPANGGLINDAAAIGRVARDAAIPYFIDAGQALGQIDVDVELLGCDMLKGAGRKYLRGPRGTAIMYVRKSYLDTLEPAFLDVLSAPFVEGKPVIRDDARRFETSEKSIALLLGLGAALKQANEIGIALIRDRIKELSLHLRSALRDVPGVVVCDLGTELSGIVSFNIEGMEASDVCLKLASEGMKIGANGVPYTPLDMATRGLSQIARASVSYLNTPDEIEKLASAVANLARQ